MLLLLCRLHNWRPQWLERVKQKHQKQAYSSIISRHRFESSN
jgi:hypothetical protein